MSITIASPKPDQVFQFSLVVAHGTYEFPAGDPDAATARLVGLLVGPENEDTEMPYARVGTLFVPSPPNWALLFPNVPVGDYRLFVMDHLVADSVVSVAFSITKKHKESKKKGLRGGPNVTFPITNGHFGMDDWAQGDADGDVTSVSGTITLQPDGAGHPVPPNSKSIAFDKVAGAKDDQGRYDWTIHFPLAQGGIYTLRVVQQGGANTGLFTDVADVLVP